MADPGFSNCSISQQDCAKYNNNTYQSRVPFTSSSCVPYPPWYQGDLGVWAGKGPHARRSGSTVTAVRQVFCLYESMRIITRIKISTFILYAMTALVGEKDVLQMNWQISHS